MGNNQTSTTSSNPESTILISKTQEKPIDKMVKLEENHSTPAKNAIFLESRSPTSRFVNKKKTCSLIPRVGKPAKRLEKGSPVDSEESEAEKEAESVEDTSQISISPMSLTSSAVKRKRKKEKKKAKQAQKEDLVKKQKAQRAEEQRNYEEKRESHRRALALYAAAVAKPIIPRNSQLCACCQASNAPNAPPSSESPENCSVSSMDPRDREELLNCLQSTGELCPTPGHYDDGLSAPPSPAFLFTEKEAEPVAPRRFAPARNREQTPPRTNPSPKPRPDTPIKKPLSLSKVVISDEEPEEIENDKGVGEESDEQSEEDVPDGSEEFEVLVHGERRKVREFQPRSLSASSPELVSIKSQSESTETTSSELVAEQKQQALIEREPIVWNEPLPNPRFYNDSRMIPVPPPIYGHFGPIPMPPPPPLPSARVPFPRAHPPYPYLQLGPPPGLPVRMMMNAPVFLPPPPPLPPRMMQSVYPMIPLHRHPPPLIRLCQPKITLENRAAPRASDEELEHIVAGVTSIFDDAAADDEPPPPSPMKPTAMDVAQKEAIEKVMENVKQTASFQFDIWKEHKEEQPKREVESEPRAAPEQDLTVVTICKKMEPYFRNTRVYWFGRLVDNTMLRDMFHEAHNREMPPAHWKILEKVCSFQPGFFHVFHELIGASIEFTYSYEQRPGESEEEERDELFTLYKALPSADGVEKFFTRFEERYLHHVIQYMSDRFIPIRVFVAILDAIFPPDHSLALSTSDLYYLATLVFGTRQFYERFTARFVELQIAESTGKRWIRRSCVSRMPMFIIEGRVAEGGKVKDVSDFINRLRPHIDDVLQLLPDTVINDAEFYRAIKLVCGFRGEQEERIWEKIIGDRAKFQQFYDVYRSFVRIEIRMGTMYLQKKSYPDDDDVNERRLLDVVVTEPPSTLHSALRSDAPEVLERKKSVRYAMPVEMEVPFETEKEDRNGGKDDGLFEQEQVAPRVEQIELVEHLEPLEPLEQPQKEKVWNLEKEIADYLNQQNMTLEQFMSSQDAEQISQLLVELFKRADHHQIAQMLETSLLRMRDKSWNEMLQLKRAAADAHEMLQKTREEHRRESDERQQRNETISLFETIDLRHESKMRIDELRARIEQLKMEMEKKVAEGVKEETLRMDREVREIRKKHVDEKRILEAEIKRLTLENANVLTDEDVAKELMEMERKQAIATAELRTTLQKKHADATRILMDEIQKLRLQNERLQKNSHNSSLSRDTITPSPEPEESGEAVVVVDSLLLKMTKKMLAELDVRSLQTDARRIMNAFIESGTNRKERKNAEKQLKEYEAHLETIEETLRENLELLSLGATGGLLDVPTVQMPFTEKVLQKIQDEQPCCSQMTKAEAAKKDEEVASDEELDGCPICLETLSDETMSCWCCRSTYHYECISKWLSINSLCPHCSRALKDPKTFPSLS